jgi:hypothetical protein
MAGDPSHSMSHRRLLGRQSSFSLSDVRNIEFAHEEDHELRPPRPPDPRSIETHPPEKSESNTKKLLTQCLSWMETLDIGHIDIDDNILDESDEEDASKKALTIDTHLVQESYLVPQSPALSSISNSSTRGGFCVFFWFWRFSDRMKARKMRWAALIPRYERIIAAVMKSKMKRLLLFWKSWKVNRIYGKRLAKQLKAAAVLIAKVRTVDVCFTIP